MPPVSDRLPRRLPNALAASVLACAALAAHAACKGQLYLTLDTGNMSQAELIAEILNKHQVRATFFLANERTRRGDHALDPSWAPYWSARVKEGHVFGSHTWRHGRLLRDTADGVIYAVDGSTERLDANGLCTELNRVGDAFSAMTGERLAGLWRAPGGRATPFALAAAESCGYRHVRWADAGFLGDELPSDRYPNEALLQRALANLRSGDILMMHLGIWSRRDPFAPMLDRLLAGLKQRGFCFATLAAQS